MNILYIAHRIPYPPNKGDKIRSFNEISFLSSCANVFLCALVDDPEDWKYAETLRRFCCSVNLASLNPKRKKLWSLYCLITGRPMSVVYFYERRLQVLVDNVLKENQIDAVLCFSGTSAEYIFKSTRGKNLRDNYTKLVMDFCDVDSSKWHEYSNRTSLPLSWLYGREGRKLADYERHVAETFDNIVFVSDQEAALFHEFVGGTHMPTSVSNGIDTDYFSPNNGCEGEVSNTTIVQELVFTGAMDYHANVDGVCWFVDNVWPVIQKQHPNTIFSIVGRNPHHRICSLNGTNNIRVEGEVDDIRPYYERATIVVVPLLIARGIQNKVLEAMAMQKAVVCTPCAAEGIGARGDVDLVIADGASDFAERVISLLEDREQRLKFGRRARNCVEQNFDWDVKMKKLASLLGLEC